MKETGRIIPECTPCNYVVETPEDESAMSLVNMYFSNNEFKFDAVNNLVIKVIDGIPCALLHNLYTKEDVEKICRGYQQKGYKMRTGKVVPTVDDMRTFLKKYQEDPKAKIQDFIQVGLGASLYLVNYEEVLLKNRAVMQAQSARSGTGFSKIKTNPNFPGEGR